MFIYEKKFIGMKSHGVEITLQTNKSSLKRTVITFDLGRHYRYILTSYREQTRESTRHRTWGTSVKYSSHKDRDFIDKITGEEAMQRIPEELWHEIRLFIFSSIGFTHENSLR